MNSTGAYMIGACSTSSKPQTIIALRKLTKIQTRCPSKPTHSVVYISTTQYTYRNQSLNDNRQANSIYARQVNLKRQHTQSQKKTQLPPDSSERNIICEWVILTPFYRMISIWYQYVTVIVTPWYSHFNLKKTL